jgi:hypothetical protein
VDEREKTELSGQAVAAPEPLALDLLGPFVVHFCEGAVRVCAPLCTDHHANILTDANDISLLGLTEPVPIDGFPTGYIYCLEAGDATPRDATKCHFTDLSKLLIATLHLDPIPAQNCHLVFRVPVPDNIVPLVPETIWIHRNGASTWVNSNSDIASGVRARGLRFIYSKCLAPPKITLCQQPRSSLDAPQPPLNTLQAEALGLDPPFYHITLRFASNSASPDEHHEDAYRCFYTMRTLIPHASQWRVDFDDSAATGVLTVNSLSGPHPLDCLAAVLIVKDPG